MARASSGGPAPSLKARNLRDRMTHPNRAREHWVPIYEYECEQDGSVIELLRSMADADKPVQDPEARGRTYKRKHSTFATGGGSEARGVDLMSRQGGCCPCGKTVGGCGGR